MKKKLIIALGFVAAFSSQICQAQNNSQISTRDLQERVQTLQKDHRVNLLTKEIDGVKRTIILHAKEDRDESTQLPIALKAVGSAALLRMAYYSGKNLYYTVAMTIKGTLPHYLNSSKLALGKSLGVTSLNVAVLAYVGFQLAKEAMKPFFGNNYHFRVFNHYTSLTGDKPFKLAKAIDKDLAKTTQDTANLEFIDFKQVEPVLAILTSPSFGYTLETIDQI